MPIRPSNHGPGDAPKSVADLPNLGPRSAEMLRSAGVQTVSQLMQADALAVYRRLKDLKQPASLNLVYAIIGAQTGVPWQTVKRTQKAAIVAKLAEMD